MDKIALVFPGQGTQYVGMGKSFYDGYEVARRVFEEANDILGFKLSDICFNGSLELLSRPENVQLAIFVVTYSAFKVFESEIGISPNMSAGHSLGEYSALACSGALSFSDAIKIIRFRSNLTKKAIEAENGTMSIIEKVSREVLETECKNISSQFGPVSIACYNSSEQFSVSGCMESIYKLEDRVFDLGGQVTPLMMSAPFHCSLMNEAKENLKGELAKIKFNQFKWPVISNIDALPYNEENIIQYISNQMVMPVQWHDITQYFINNGVKTLIEIGPKSVLANLVANCTKEITTLSYKHKNDGSILKGKVQQAECSDEYSIIDACLIAAVSSKNSNWNNEEYQTGVIEPCAKIRQIQAELESSGTTKASIEQIKTAFDMLKMIFATKRIPFEKQSKRFYKILKDADALNLISQLNIPVQ